MCDSRVVSEGTTWVCGVRPAWQTNSGAFSGALSLEADVKFGMVLYPYDVFPDLPALVEYVQRAEELGYDYVGISEHVIFPLEHERTLGQMWWDPIVLATVLANATRSIRLCFTVLILPQHDPFYLAKQVATLDVVSNGRIELGVGVGWLRAEFEWLGADFHGRGALMEEYVRLIKTLWTTHPSEFESRHFTFSDASFFPKPLQHPHPPIYIAGDPTISAQRAARVGDGWMPMPGGALEFDAGLRILHDTLREQERMVEGFSIFGGLPLIDPGEEQKEHAKQARAGRERSDPETPALQGDYDAAIELVREAEKRRVTHLNVTFGRDYRTRLSELRGFAENVIGRL